MIDESAHTPLVSFGLPVRNGERFLPVVLDSILAQDLEDLEVVVCDNQSSDATAAIAEEYARRDRRVRFVQNESNVGQITNFNRVLELSRGTYFRWIGADDHVEPGYASSCVRELEEHPEAIAVTTYQSHVGDDGTLYYAEYRGERLDSDRPHHRFRRMLWFLTADYRYIDPIYTMIRRDALMGSSRFRAVPRTDRVLAAELSLIGPFRHIPQRLARRRRVPADYDDQARLDREYHPECPNDLRWSSWRMARLFGAIIRSQPLTGWQKACCWHAVVCFVASIESRLLRHWLRGCAGRAAPKSVRTWLKGEGKRGREPAPIE